MILHYIKIAFRNLWKYRNQTLISVLGLSAGFTCFALATLWVRYEMTYDSFHKNAKHQYVVYLPSSGQNTYGSKMLPPPLGAYLKATFPEIAHAVSFSPPSQRTFTVGGVEFQAFNINIDSSFMRMFDVKILEGSSDFLLPDSKKLAITQKKARQLFGIESPIGKTITFLNNEMEIGAVISGMKQQSNYTFDIAQVARVFSNQDTEWYMYSPHVIIELFPETNLAAFEKKLFEHEIVKERTISKLMIKPLNKMRYSDPGITKEVKFQHLLMFALSGFLVVLCSLINYLTLFVSRFRIRQKELALRMVCGASGGSLYTMLSTEFILTLFLSVLLGLGLSVLGYKPFTKLSSIDMSLSSMYLESFIYIAGIILVSLLVFWLTLLIFRYRSLNLSIRRNYNNVFRKSSVVVQLVISIGFAFCTIVMVKQIYYLFHTEELGFSFKNRGSMLVWGNNGDIFADKLKQIPEIIDVVDKEGVGPLIPGNRASREISSWDEKPLNADKISIEITYVTSEFVNFYGYKLLMGELLTETDPQTMALISESAVKAFGWHEPIGKKFDDKYTVKGVIKNVYNYAPTIQLKPVIHLLPPSGRMMAFRTYTNSEGVRVTENARYVLFSFHDGMWKSCKEKIEQLKNDFDFNNLNNTEELYYNYLKSELALLKLLYAVASICLLICVFGFVSLVSLTCEERRKSIAIRKINGATVGDILSIFIKEYALLLMIGAAIAFPAGFLLMLRWLEQYVKQTSIPAWVYISIIAFLALMIVVCVGWQVYKASRENPAEVVKNE